MRDTRRGCERDARPHEGPLTLVVAFERDIMEVCERHLPEYLSCPPSTFRKATFAEACELEL